MAERIVSLHTGYRYDGEMVDGYIARPTARGTHPAVVLISGMSGLNPFQREMTRSFARAGFVALSPDLFDGYSAPDQASALLAKNSLDIDLAVQRLAAGADWLRRLPWVEDHADVGVVGFCLGGGLALLCLGRTDRFRPGVIYYQSLFPDPSELEGIKAKVLCHYGTDDKSTPSEEVQRFRADIDRLGIPNEVHFYQGAKHSFLNPGNNPSPEQERAASESLERTFGFLHSELGPHTAIPELETPRRSTRWKLAQAAGVSE
jgi:carboxymethylenebutenolidase